MEREGVDSPRKRFGSVRTGKWERNGYLTKPNYGERAQTCKLWSVGQSAKDRAVIASTPIGRLRKG